jgi:hypothetical protein
MLRGGYRRMAIFGSHFQKGVLEGAPEGTPVLSTDHAARADAAAGAVGLRPER